ncbi:MAG TPA: SBBP repeat-containing protein [Candidatus Syntrophosphaera sp.]|nr:SBBP repeat-containing protein [Candidatus Syntrophosphaera sp.]
MPSLKAVFLCVFLLSAFAGLGAQSVPEWCWAVQSAGSTHIMGYAITVDNNGYSYVAGYFDGAVSFGTISLNSGSGHDIFVCKLDSAGNYLWAVHAGGDNGGLVNDIVLDRFGNIYITGAFWGSVSFGTTTLTSNGSDDIFVSKLDNNGNFLWAKHAGGAAYDEGHSIALDSSGASYVTGLFHGTADFGSTSLTSNGYNDIFVCKIDASGNFVWAKQAGGTGLDNGYGIAVDNLGNCYVTGSFNDSATFGSSTLISSGSYDIFVCKIDMNGNWHWVNKAGGTGADEGKSIAADGEGNIIITGYFGETAWFGTTVFDVNGVRDVFICKIDSYGNWLWANQAGGSGDDLSISISVDYNGNSYVTGCFNGTANFGTTSLISSGSSDIFICKLDSSGNNLWAKRAGGTSSEISYSIAVDGAGNIYVTGYYSGTASFGMTSLTCSGSYDIFIAKLGPTLSVLFSADATQGIEPFTVQFSDNSVTGLAPIINWFWTFGDGNVSIVQNPSHTYFTPGVYTVTLTVMDQYNYIASIVKPNYITIIERVETVELTTAENLSFGSVYLEEQSDWQAVSFSNMGNVDLSVSETHFLAEPLHFELSEPFTGLALPPGETGSLMVRFAPQAVGALSDTLFIVNNSSNLPLIKVRLQGTGEYVPPKAPLNVNVTMDGDHAVITWDAVTQNTHDQPLTPDYYFIFNSSDPYGVFGYHGSASGLQYIHPTVGAFQPRMFYRVVAYKYYRRGACDLSALKPGMSEAEVWRVLGR